MAVSKRQTGSKHQAETETVTSKPKPKLKPKSKRGAKTNSWVLWGVWWWWWRVAVSCMLRTI